MTITDFQRSFLTFRIDLAAQSAITLSHKPPTTENNARIQLECICRLRSQTTGESFTYVLGAACKTERVGGPGNLWLLPNADFNPIVGDSEFLIIKSFAQRGPLAIARDAIAVGDQPERQSGLVKTAWDQLTITRHQVEARELDSVTSIIETTFAGTPLVARTEYSEAGFDILLEYPVKTFNVSVREQVFQTDTGPVLLPDFSSGRDASRLVEHFDLAYSAFNVADWIEFIVNTPTPVSPEVSVNHYSEPRRIENVRNTLFEL